METKEIIRNAIQEMIVPELKVIRSEYSEIKATLQVVSKRLDDCNQHLVDLSRRVDETNTRIDTVTDSLNSRIDTLRDNLEGKVDTVRVELSGKISENNTRIDETNMRIDRLYQVVVRREEHESLEERTTMLEKQVAGIKEEGESYSTES